MKRAKNMASGTELSLLEEDVQVKMPGRTKKKNKIKKRFNSSCLVYEPWFSYISYVFHGTIKARGNPQCLQLLLNITRFGPRGRVLGLRRLLEKGERGRGGAVGVEERRKERGREGGSWK